MRGQWQEQQVMAMVTKRAMVRAVSTLGMAMKRARVRVAREMGMATRVTDNKEGNGKSNECWQR